LRKAAFCVPYPSAWVVYPLRSSARLHHNFEPVSRVCSLSAGDVITLGSVDWLVERISLAPEEPELDEPFICCYLVVRSGAEQWRATTDTDMLIGTNHRCRLSLPAEVGLAPEHAFLACHEGQWYLYSLTGKKDLLREGAPPAGTLRLRHGDIIRLGGTDVLVEVSLTNAPAEEILTPEGDDAHQTEAGCDRADTTAGLSEDGQSTFLPCPGSDPLYARARGLCVWLQAALQGNGPAASRWLELTLAVKTRLGARPKDPAVALERFRSDLEQACRNRDLLLDLARFFESLGYGDLCRLVLKECLRLDPKDLDVLLALVKLYMLEGQRPDLPVGQRLESFAKAEKYAHKARTIKPEDEELLELLKQAEVEQTLLKGNFPNLLLPLATPGDA
jgi:hypothetical protein